MQPRCYLNKLPAKLSPDDLIIIVDPMLATGGTIVFAMEELISRGASDSNIRIVCAVAAPPALTKLGDKFKGLRVYAGMIDAAVSEKGFIIPGMGDAGDRAFNTGGGGHS
jgi:uracil phosphoribosyltransferase